MNDDKDLTNGNQQSEDENPKDKIPLWLQGLEEPEDDRTNETEEREINADSWVNEIENEDEMIESDEDLQANANKGIQLPEWIRENPEFENNEQVSNDLSEEAPIKIRDDFDIEMEPDDKIGLEEDFSENEPTEDGFIDISELDTESPREPVQFIPIEEDDVSEELPVWLHDMITDQPEEPQIYNEPMLGEEIKDEEVVLEEQEKVELESKEGNWQEITTAEDQVQSASQLASDEEQFLEILDEEITKPVMIDAVISDELHQEDVEIPPVEEGKDALERAKTMMAQGEILSAIDFIRQHLDKQPSQGELDEIQNWIGDAIGSNPDKKCDLLELQGDVALRNNEPDQAFYAYSQALKTLLSNKEVNNGIG